MPVIGTFIKENKVRGRIYKKTWYQCICDQCGIEYEKTGQKSMLKKKHIFCSYECSDISKRTDSAIEKERAKLRKEKTGFANPMNNPEIRKKRLETIYERYGGHFQATDEWKQKRSEAFLEKYGVKEIFQAEEFKEKRKDTLIEQYGTDGIMSLDEFKEKSRQTQFEKFGGWYTGTEEHHQRQAASNLERYGYEYSFQSAEIQEKAYLSKNGCTREEYLEKLPAIEAYRNEVWKYTNMQDIQSLEHSDKRGRKKYHLDHQYSIIEGFRNDVPPEVIGNICNLRFIPGKINRQKNSDCSITLEQLYEAYNGN
jgi:hypothetical protein